MKHYLLPYLLPLLLLVFSGTEALAQTPANLLVVHVDELTPAIRDGLVRDLKGRSDLKLQYACVPAGILIFEQPDRTARLERSQVDPVLHRRIARSRISDTTLDIAGAERLCAQYRQP